MGELGHLKANLEPIWTNLGQHGLTRGQLGPHLGSTWPNVGQHGGDLKPTWGSLGANLGHLEPTWANLGPAWADMIQRWPIWDQLEANMVLKIIENLLLFQGFCNISENPGKPLGTP